jgi:2-oxoglutarate ferredoxin oxidoreductase subunit beta
MTATPLTKKDFKTDQDVRWCPGCGDYGVLNAVQTAMANLGRPRHETLIISGIGCSSRFPYYMETYGFHTIHGRAPAIATGAKLANPDLDVWVITGDGDGLSIGGNHLIHLLRRNLDLNVILFNNRIYGLTKGQYSPTSEQGKKTKSTPMGSVDHPFDPIRLALGAGATFVARSVDIFAQHLVETIEKAAAHRGTSLIEVYQNCNIFNDGAFKSFTDKGVRDQHTLQLEHGKPVKFGTDEDQRGIVIDGGRAKVVRLDGSVKDGDLLVWDETHDDPSLAMALAALPQHGDDAAVPLGVFRRVERPTFEKAAVAQVADAKQKRPQTLDALLAAGETWDVR